MDSLKTVDLSTLTGFKVNMVGAWFATCASSIILAIWLLFYLFQIHIVNPTITSYQLYQALPESQIQITDSIQTRDARAKILENFLLGYHSILTADSDLFIQVADQYNLDWRLLPAIAMQESNGGRVVPNNSYNPFGFGIYGGKIIHFSSWEEAINTVGKSLRNDYLNQGLKTPEEIMAKYTPPSLKKGGSWAIGVNSFMAELQ